MITAQTLPVSEEESGALRGTELPSLPNDFGDLGLLCAHCIHRDPPRISETQCPIIWWKESRLWRRADLGFCPASIVYLTTWHLPSSCVQWGS